MKLHRFRSRWAPLVGGCGRDGVGRLGRGRDRLPPTNQYTGCLKAGQIYSVTVAPATPTNCVKPAVQITWNQTGPQGAPGTPGTPGTNGFNTLTKTTPETAGANCANGGSKNESGLDNGDGGGTANDGTLQAGEVDARSYVCNGAKGDKGDTGATGPSSLDALQGSPCTIHGNTSTTQVDVDSTTGAVSIICKPALTVSATVSGGTMDYVDLRDQTTFTNDNQFNVNSTVSRLMPPGHFADVYLESGFDSTGGGSPFTYTCPPVQTSLAHTRHKHTPVPNPAPTTTVSVTTSR